MRGVSRWWRAGVPCSRRLWNVVRASSVGAFALTLGAAPDAHALAARVRWLPSSGAAVAGYDLFVRRSGQAYDAAIDAGLPPAGAGGVLAYDVTDLADGVVYYFTVVARGTDDTRSACAGELALGSSDACVVESCCPGQACTFGGAPDGTPCDDTNPCRLCRAAACTPSAESTLDTRRLKLVSRASAPRVNVSGAFTPADVLDPAADGLTLSLSDATGTALLTAVVPPDAVHTNTAGTWFILARDRRDGALQMLSLRLRNGTATVRARLSVDPGTSTGPLAWAVASGRSCGRSAVLTCSATPRGLSCR